MSFKFKFKFKLELELELELQFLRAIWVDRAAESESSALRFGEFVPKSRRSIVCGVELHEGTI